MDVTCVEKDREGSLWPQRGFKKCPLKRVGSNTSKKTIRLRVRWVSRRDRWAVFGRNRERTKSRGVTKGQK